MRRTDLFRAAMRACLGAAALTLPWIGGAFAAPGDREVDVELVFAADVSGSMDLEEAALQRQGFAAAMRDPDVIAAIQRGGMGRIAVTYMEWAGPQFQATLIDWTEIDGPESAGAFADRIEALPVTTERYTSISTALDVAARRFDDNGFAGLRRIIDISGDGPNNLGGPVDLARDKVLAKGVTVNGLPIINGRRGPFGLEPLADLDLYYEDCVIGGPGAFVVAAQGFEDFARAARLKMILEISGLQPPPARRARVVEVSQGGRPPCDAGERQLLERYGDDL